MYKKGEYVIYRHDVCMIMDIKNNDRDTGNSYVLVPISDKSLKINVPIDNRGGNIKPLIDKKQIQLLIKEIPNIEIISSNNKLIETDYKNLLLEGSHESLIKIIKTTYLRNQERLDDKKKISDKDEHYFQLAEKYLYNELSVVLNKTYEDTKKYVIDEIEKMKA